MKRIAPDLRRRLLLSSFVFDALPRDALDTLLEQATDKTLRQGETIFQKGEAGCSLGAVLKGRVRISDLSADGYPVTLDLIEPGQVFGELALLDGKPRNTNATAMEDSRVILVERCRFLPLIAAHPGVRARLITELCDRVRATRESIETAARIDVPGRLASRLLRLAAEYGESQNGLIRLEVPLSYADLGQLMGCSGEVVSDTIAGWENEGILLRRSGQIFLMRPSALRLLAARD